jgi:hypothetical protein
MLSNGLTVCLSALLLTDVARGATVSLSATADTCLFEQQKDFNFGKQGDMPVGTVGVSGGYARGRTLLRFDPGSALPSNAVVRSASLRLTVTRVPRVRGVPSTFSLHRLLNAWSEGMMQGDLPGGASANIGEPTWNARAFPNELWGQPGCQAGVDYDAQAMSSQQIQGLGSYLFQFDPTELPIIESWLRNPETNFGWILLSQGEDQGRSARRFGSRENSDVSARPELLIEYDVPSGTGPKITGISIGVDRTAIIEFVARANVRYRLEFSTDLFPSFWESATAYHSKEVGGPFVLRDGTQIVGRRYYRIAAIE